MKTLWFDLTNSPHVHFFRPIIKRYSKDFKIIISVRTFSETTHLAASELPVRPIVIGRHGGRRKLNKVYCLLSRLLRLSIGLPKFDVALSCGSVESSVVARLRGKKAITFDDNDISPNWMYSRFADFAFFPKAIPRDRLIRQGFDPSSIIQYDGFKEDIYISDYEPDPGFCQSLPFAEYVIVRPENLQANYVGRGKNTIVPELLRLSAQAGFNILYLPRYNKDRELARGNRRIYVPPKAISGLDAVYYSQAVVSGAGTFAREAACLGKPAVSFFAGSTLLAVDRHMIDQGWVYHSRDPRAILEYLGSAKPRSADLARCRTVKNEVLGFLDHILADGR
jgi:predicted glycosyltransferase